MAKKKNKLPKGKHHRRASDPRVKPEFAALAGDLAELDVLIRPARTEQIAIRLYQADLEVLQQLASARGIGHTTLARSIIEDWLGKVRKKIKG